MNENRFQKNTHPNPLNKMIPRAVQLKSGIKPLTFARKVNNAYSKSPVKSARPSIVFVKSAQTGNKTFYDKKVFYDHKWTPKTRISKPAVATARPKVSTGGLVNNKRESVGNVVKASTRWE